MVVGNSRLDNTPADGYSGILAVPLTDVGRGEDMAPRIHNLPVPLTAHLVADNKIMR